MFVTGSILEHLKQRSTNRCEPFMKPGTDPEAVGDRTESACGCIRVGGMIESCRDIDDIDGCKPNATTDCKKAVQEMNDVWIEGAISDIFCSNVRRSTQMLALTCNV